MHYGAVVYNAIIFFLGIEGGDNYCVGFIMVGVQYVLITTAISDGEAPSVVFVYLLYWFVPTVHYI